MSAINVDGNQASLAERAMTALDEIKTSPVTQESLRRTDIAARLLGIDPTRYTLTEFDALFTAMYEKAASLPLLKHLAAKDVTGDDDANLRGAVLIVEALEAINERRQSLKDFKGFAEKVTDEQFVFRLAGPEVKQTQRDYILARLGVDSVDARLLIKGLESIDLNINHRTPQLNAGVLCIYANRKLPQEQRHVYEHLANGAQTVNLAIEALLQARSVGVELATIDGESLEVKGARVKQEALAASLSEGTATMLMMLVSGVIRVNNTSCGALHIDGSLQAGYCLANGYPQWDLGRVSPETYGELLKDINQL